MENKESKRISIEEKVLEELKEGKTYRQIADSLWITTARVSDIKVKLVNEGKITQEEIDNAKQEKREEIKSWVLELIKARKLYFEISKITGLSYSALMEIKQELTQEGKINFNNNGIIQKETPKKVASGSQGEKEKKDVHRTANSQRNARGKTVESQIKQCKRKIKNREPVYEYIKELEQAICTNPEVVKIESILFVAQYYANTQRTQMSIQFLQKCISASKGNSERKDTLIKAKETVVLYQKRKLAERRLASGAPTGVVSRDVGLSEKEVVDIWRKMQEKKELQDKSNRNNGNNEVER